MIDAIFYMIVGAMAVLVALCFYAGWHAIRWEGQDRRHRWERQEKP